MKDPTNYLDLLLVLNGHRQAKLANNTYVMWGREADTIAVVLHGTPILTFDPPIRTSLGPLGERIIPATGEWNTPLTVDRLNRFTPERFTFHRANYGTLVTVTDEGGPTLDVRLVLYLDPTADRGEGIYERMTPRD